MEGAQGEGGETRSGVDRQSGFLDANYYIWNAGQWGPTVQHSKLCVIRSLCSTTAIEETL